MDPRRSDKGAVADYSDLRRKLNCFALTLQKDKFGNTALHYASLGGKLTILTNLLHKLLRFKANINTRNHFGQTAASLAKKARMDDCVKVFETETTEADFGSKVKSIEM